MGKLRQYLSDLINLVYTNNGEPLRDWSEIIGFYTILFFIVVALFIMKSLN
jgi:hypothetical protein